MAKSGKIRRTTAGPPPEYITPPGSWSLESWADVFNPTFSAAPGGGAPVLGPVTQMGQPGDVVAVGGAFSNSALFNTYSQTTSVNGHTYETSVLRCVTDEATVRINTSVPQDSLILLYALVGGQLSTPKAINKADAWWVQSYTTGSDYAVVGDTVAVNGTNLSKSLVYPYTTSSPSTKCMIWLYSSVLGSGQMVTCTSINPYCATFVMPALWAITTSTTSITFGTGSKGPFTLNTSPGYAVGLAVTLYNSTGFMKGTVTACTGTSLTVNVTEVEDGTSGTVASWTIAPDYDVDLYVHNGHGGAYGWSRKVTFHVTSRASLAINFDKVTPEAMPAPTGTDDLANFNTAKSNIGSACPATIQLQAGTYRLSGRFTLNGGFNKPLQLKGHASGTTIIPTTSFVPTSGEMISANPNSELNNLTIDSTGLASGSVTGASNATPIRITTGAAHGLTTGDAVRIYGVGGNTAANGGWTSVTVIDTTHFDLVLSAGNGTYTSGGSWAQACGVRVPRLVNVTHKFRLPTTYKSVTSTVVMTGCAMEGTYFEAQNCVSAYINSNSFKGTDLMDQVFNISNGRGGVTFTNNTAQHYNPGGTNLEKGHGRIYVSAQNLYGTQRNVYIAGNSTPTRYDNPEGFGDAEFYLWEGALCSSSSMATAATSTSVTITDTASSGWIQTRNAAITAGRGKGQSRPITDVVGNVLTVYPPWDITPDTTSRVNVVGTAHRIVIYNNTGTGGNVLSDGTDQGDNQGWNLFSGSSEFYADANTFTDMNYGYSEWAIGETASLTVGICPLFFNLVQNCSFPHANHVVRTVVDPPLDSETSEMSGNIRRRLTATTAIVTGWKLLTTLAGTESDAFQDCSFSGEKFGIVSTPSQSANTVLWNTAFVGSGASGSVAKTNITVHELGTTSFTGFLA